MKKISKLKKSSIRKTFSWVKLGLFIGVLLLAIILLNSQSIINSFIASPTINKITEVDSSTAKTDAEAKAAKELNDAADKVERVKTPKDKAAAMANLLIAGSTYEKIVKENTVTIADYNNAKSEVIKDLQTGQDNYIVSAGKDGYTLNDNGVSSFLLTNATPLPGSGGTSSGASCPGANSGIGSGQWAQNGYGRTSNKILPDGSNRCKEGQECPYRECMKCSSGSWGGLEICGEGEATHFVTRPDETDKPQACWSGGSWYADSPVAVGEQYCLNGSWVPDYSSAKKKECTEGGLVYVANSSSCQTKAKCDPTKQTYVESTNSCTDNPTPPPLIVVVPPVVLPTATKTSPASCSSLSCPAGSQKHVLAANMCYCEAGVKCSPGVSKDGKTKTECNPSKNGTLLPTITTCPVAFNSKGVCTNSSSTSPTASEPISTTPVTTVNNPSTCPNGTEPREVANSGGQRWNCFKEGEQTSSDAVADTAPTSNSTPTDQTSTEQGKNVGESCGSGWLTWGCNNKCGGVYTTAEFYQMGQAGSYKQSYCGTAEDLKARGFTNLKNIVKEHSSAPSSANSESTNTSSSDKETIFATNSDKSALEQCYDMLEINKDLGTCVEGEIDASGKTTYRYIPDPTASNNETSVLLKDGESCVGGSNSSCNSGDCRSIRNESGSRDWYCMKPRTVRDIINPGGYKNGSGCSPIKPNECESGYCADNLFNNTCEPNPFKKSPAPNDQSLNITPDPGATVPQVAQTGTTALDTGPLVSNPAVSNPAGPPAANVFTGNETGSSNQYSSFQSFYQGDYKGNGIDKNGCYLTVASMIIANYGTVDKGLNPEQLNKKYLNNNYVYSGYDTIFDGIANERNGIDMISVSDKAKKEGVATYVANNATLNRPVSLAIYCTDCYDGGHFVLAVGKNEKGEPLIYDPLRKNQKEPVPLNSQNYPGLNFNNDADVHLVETSQ